MLADEQPVAFLATADADRARSFYEGVLGLPLVADDGFALVYQLAGLRLRLARVETLAPQPFTVLGWDVADVDAAMRELGARGVTFERFPFMPADGPAVWEAPGGTRIAWFRDPDGNTLSLSQHREPVS